MHLSIDDSMILRDGVRILLQSPEDSLGIDAATVSNKLGYCQLDNATQ
jgi:hypothetical protein